jgi:hypothetical protein
MTKQIKLKETPKIQDNGQFKGTHTNDKDFKVVYDNPDALKESMDPNTANQTPDSNLYQINAIIKDCEAWGTTVQVAQWGNKTGFDITICGKGGSFQHLSITKEEAKIINDAISQLRNIKE